MISLVDFKTVLGATLTTNPTHSVRNLAIVGAYNDASATLPTRPADWIDLYTSSVSTGSLRLSFKYTTSSSDSFGTWTNADHLFVSIWSGSPGRIITPIYHSVGTGTSTSMSWNAQPAGTFNSGADDVGVLLYGTNRNTTNVLSAAVGSTTHIFDQGDGVAFQTVGKYQVGRTVAWAAAGLTLGTSSAWRTVLITLVEEQLVTASEIIDPLSHSMIR